MLRRLDDPDLLVREERQGTLEKMAIWNEVGIENGNEVARTRAEPVVHVSGFRVRIVRSRQVDRASLCAEGLQPITPAVIEDIDLELVFRIVECQRPDDRPLQDIEWFIVGRNKNVDCRQILLFASEERLSQAVRFGTPVNVTAHQNEEKNDLGEGKELDDEDYPNPPRVRAIGWIGKNGLEKTPDHIAQCDSANDGTGDRARPALMP
ncbi:hypothetical protein D9M69_292050 [compost metagenome]